MVVAVAVVVDAVVAVVFVVAVAVVFVVACSPFLFTARHLHFLLPVLIMKRHLFVEIVISINCAQTGFRQFRKFHRASFI